MAIRFGRYETQEALAVGGMAKVYRGVARSEAGFERPIAVKIMHPHIALDPEFVNMFLDEARVAAKIHHPNVVATHDVQRSPMGLFLVMDYVDGVDLGLVLRAMRKQDQRIEVGVVVRLLLETLKGLQAAHELTSSDGTPLNVVHRDVSPQNILVDRSGFVKITDFGVAHATERLATTRGGELKGKMGYLAPEHVIEGRVDARSDVYAAGVVFWELLTNKRLFKADERMSVLADIMAGRITDPSVHAPDLPAAINQVCLKSLALEPSERYGSATEFAAALRCAAEDSGVRIAEAEELAALVETSKALELAAKTREQLNREETTQADVTVLEPLPLEPPRPSKRARPRLAPWLPIALGVMLGTAGILYGALSQTASPIPPAIGVPITELEVTAMPNLTDPASVAAHDDDPGALSASPEASPSAQTRRNRERTAAEAPMYHPSGL